MKRIFLLFPLPLSCSDSGPVFIFLSAVLGEHLIIRGFHSRRARASLSNITTNFNTFDYRVLALAKNK